MQGLASLEEATGMESREVTPIIHQIATKINCQTIVKHGTFRILLVGGYFLPLTLESDGQSTSHSVQALQKAKEKGLSTQLMDNFR